MAEFVSKMNGGLQELDETHWWLELLAESDLINPSRLTELRDETNHLIAIVVTCIRNAPAKTTSEEASSALRPPPTRPSAPRSTRAQR